MHRISRRALCQALGISAAAAPAFLKSTVVLAADFGQNYHGLADRCSVMGPATAHNS